LELFLLAHLRIERAKLPKSMEFVQKLEKMLEYVLGYTQPDGRAPQVGDSDDGRAFALGPVEAQDDHRSLLAIGAALFGRADMKPAAAELPASLVWLLGERGVERWDALPLLPEGGERAALPGSRLFGPSRIAVLRHEGAHAFLDAGDVGIQGRGAHGHDEGL